MVIDFPTLEREASAKAAQALSCYIDAMHQRSLKEGSAFEPSPMEMRAITTLGKLAKDAAAREKAAEQSDNTPMTGADRAETQVTHAKEAETRSESALPPIPSLEKMLQLAKDQASREGQESSNEHNTDLKPTKEDYLKTSAQALVASSRNQAESDGGGVLKSEEPNTSASKPPLNREQRRRLERQRKKAAKRRKTRSG